MGLLGKQGSSTQTSSMRKYIINVSVMCSTKLSNTCTIAKYKSIKGLTHHLIVYADSTLWDFNIDECLDMCCSFLKVKKNYNIVSRTLTSRSTTPHCMYEIHYHSFKTCMPHVQYNTQTFIFSTASTVSSLECFPLGFI